MSNDKPRLTQPPPDGGWPELPVTPAWGLLVKAAMKRRGWNQTDVADAIGLTQGMMSNIVNGVSGASSYVWQLCLVLELDPPHQFYRDDLERRWVEAGRILRRRSERAFTGVLTSAESMRDALGDEDT